MARSNQTTGLSRVTESEGHLRRLTSEYRNALTEIATALARQERAERVLVKHVDEAFRILAASSNNRRPWYQRHETEIAFGAAAVTGGYSFAQNATAVLLLLNWCQPSFLEWLPPCLTAAIWLIGGFMVLHGFLRQRGVFWAR
jgi:hypothetical protein